MNTRTEDTHLASEQFPSLNRRFYTSPYKPHEYVDRRLMGLALSTSSHKGIAEAVRDGLTIGRLTMSATLDEEDESTFEHYLVEETTVLLHHAAEALCRLYLAHVDMADCPWLEVARLRSFKVFKESAATLRAGLIPSGKVMSVFTGSAVRPDGDPQTQERWSDREQALTKLLCLSAETLLTDSNLYNAAKHGLALVPGQAAIAVGDATGSEVFSVSPSPSVTFLETASKESGGRWQETTAWVSIDRNIALTALISQAIQDLWSVATVRYLGMPDGGIRLSGISCEMVDHLSYMEMVDEPNPSGVQMSRMSQGLLYYSEAKTAARPNRPGHHI